jgi:hypothetical protein
VLALEPLVGHPVAAADRLRWWAAHRTRGTPTLASTIARLRITLTLLIVIVLIIIVVCGCVVVVEALHELSSRDAFEEQHGTRSIAQLHITQVLA